MAFNRNLAAMATAFVATAGICLSAQTTFTFVISATSADGAPVADLRPDDVLMTENGVKQEVVKVEPLSIPMKLTIAVDNGIDSEDALAHYRNGLTGMVEALPPDVEVTLITIAPQPRTVVKSTTDRAQLLKGINGFAPEQARPRFSDAIVEYADRLQKEAKDKNAPAYLPVLVMVSTAGLETRSYQPKDIEKAVQYLVSRHAKLNAIVVSTKPGDTAAAAAIDMTMQSIVALPAAKLTNGRYEGLSVSNRMRTLLPEWGKDLANLHKKQVKQFKVTVERRTSGDLQSPRIELARPGLSGAVTRDGYLP